MGIVMAVQIYFIGNDEPIVMPTKNWNSTMENNFINGQNFKTILTGGRRLLVNTPAITHIVITED
jgi:hypothetical protein